MLHAAALVAVIGAIATPAFADRSTFQTFDADQGLSSLGGVCMLQDHAGYILLCTEHGVFAYDGRRFVNLDTVQGLRQGGDVYGIALTSAGRIAVEFADEVLVSDRPSDSSHPPSSLSFQSVLHPGVTFYDERPNRIAPWHDGFVLLAGDATEKVVVPDTGKPRLDSMGYTLEERSLLKDATSVFSAAGRLWETFDDGRICIADPGAVRCFGAAHGLRAGPWLAVVDGPDNHVLARSASSFASFDPDLGRWTVADLPGQGGRYDNYKSDLGLFRTPDGTLVTQADQGLAVLGPAGWRLVTVDEGAPSGTIVSAMTDSIGRFWFHVLGRGLVRWVGYGHWETFQKADGLSEGIPWKTVRSPSGPLWVATDTAVDEIVRRGSSLRVSRVFPGASFALAVGPHGEIWHSADDGVRMIDPVTGNETRIDAPPVNAIVSGPGEQVWLGTKTGLLGVLDHPGQMLRTKREGASRAEVIDIVADGQGGVYYLSAGRLRHRRVDGGDVSIAGRWPGEGFDPISIAMEGSGVLWIGGAGGLYRLTLLADTIADYRAIPTEDTRTNTILAVMMDHRGWIWAGTALGVSVYNGQRWVSIDTDGGLVSNDVDQGGLREDADGSVWIVTTQGLSHLLDPASIFVEQPVKAVFSGAFLGDRAVLGQTLPYTTDALSVLFGAPSYGGERSFLFRYRLSGVDSRWAESSSGIVRYAFVPPGQHMMMLVGYNQLTHRASPPANLLIDVAFPWWRQWWSEALWILCVFAFGSGVMRLRFRAMTVQQTELTRRVETATEQLRYQAAHDSLTGLLNRSEIERRLADRLSSGLGGDEMIVALMDIDHFKRVNDSYGHLGGDDVLRALGRLVSKAVRDAGYAGRYGGEEILIVLDDLDGRGAERVLDLHHVIRGGSFNAAGQAICVTCSIGLAWAVRGDNWESLIARADDALYRAKASGRDQVVENGRDKVTRGLSSERRLRPSAPGLAD